MRAGSVLVVDPDPGAADVVRIALPRSDVHRVDTAYEALAHFEHRHVDVLIAERLLPGASADELLRRLERAGHAVPVVLCSHRRTPMEHQHRFVIAAFTKPVDPEALRRVVLGAATITAASA
jgi:DNA-binding NtrC family response regulator